jgi:hypothetical protein
MNDNESKSNQAREKCSACFGTGRILGPVKLGFPPKITPPVCTKCNGTGGNPNPHRGQPSDTSSFPAAWRVNRVAGEATWLTAGGLALVVTAQQRWQLRDVDRDPPRLIFRQNVGLQRFGWIRPALSDIYLTLGSRCATLRGRLSAGVGDARWTWRTKRLGCALASLDCGRRCGSSRIPALRRFSGNLLRKRRNDQARLRLKVRRPSEMSTRPKIQADPQPGNGAGRPSVPRKNDVLALIPVVLRRPGRRTAACSEVEPFDGAISSRNDTRPAPRPAGH